MAGLSPKPPGILTDIKAQARNPQRVNLYLDNQFWLSLDIFQVTQLGLRLGLPIGPELFDKLRQESLFGKAYARALDLLARRPRSEREIIDYAFRKKWPQAITERVVKRLGQKGYLDDRRFAAQWARSRQAGRPRSRRLLAAELRQKGVSADAAAAALDEYDEQAALQKLIRQKSARYSDPRKLAAYLARQGFDWDDIKQALSLS
ncbi:MAG: regulatory protein RecX [Candidatus Chaera renei]|uniref:Regulatory protein RecX n=1 Tax=Candidatus Chaera renei TaxID=2506947 RepID=A0A4Q0AK11_9BACT|nr:MAG: regulatory protein RecX [Candidatus Chaera renei]